MFPNRQFIFSQRVLGIFEEESEGFGDGVLCEGF